MVFLKLLMMMLLVSFVGDGRGDQSSARTLRNEGLGSRIFQKEALKIVPCLKIKKWFSIFKMKKKRTIRVIATHKKKLASSNTNLLFMELWETLFVHLDKKILAYFVL